ncbi:vacuolar ATPase assembly integral membrane protein VMA21 homolog [Lutzomyia longipalpis]|uniref:vacuolar ATPase assembly integral membrane protein VMA21 homolog n=1 Tax=Lutzomyia longipalpis TaxID=7200 RepID=UPI0024847028|nr:vacuolar ATPase assembly integral membrane protein VMA21 homolog [Lutzomyia longipalpis]
MSKKNKTKGDSGSSGSSPNFSVFFTVLFYCLLIILLPIIGFFISKHFIFDGYFQLSQISSNIYSAVVAVIALHIALFCYIYRAYFETESAPGRLHTTKED